MEDTHIIHIPSSKSSPSDSDISLPTLSSIIPCLSKSNKSSTQDFSLFAIFDGHSGSKVSEFMSHNLLKALQEAKSNDLFNPEFLKLTIELLDQQILKDNQIKHHGSTVCFIIVRDNKAAIVNLGDSRVLLIGRKGIIKFATKDHKPTDPEESKRIIQAGGFVKNERINGHSLNLSRTVGDSKLKDGRVIAIPDVTILTFKPTDRFLIFCDGMHECMTNKEIVNELLFNVSAQKLVGFDDPSDMLANMIDESLLRGSQDNMSSMLLEFGKFTPHTTKHSVIIQKLTKSQMQDLDFLEKFDNNLKRIIEKN
jgi:serine/threonine protein phosphatase PrpC